MIISVGLSAAAIDVARLAAIDLDGGVVLRRQDFCSVSVADAASVAVLEEAAAKVLV